MTLDQATKIADAVIQYRSVNRWFLPGTREKLIEAAWSAKSQTEAFDSLQSVIWDSEIDDPGSDPCDEVWHDRWFYFHPALVL